MDCGECERVRRQFVLPLTHHLLRPFRDRSLALTYSYKMTYSIFCMGNPLLDIQVTNGEELLKKYDLKANDAILAEEKHTPL